MGKRSLKYEPNPYTGTLINTGMRARTHVHNDRTSSSQSGLGVFPVYERRHLLASPQNAKHLDAFPALHFINVSRGFKPGEMPARLNNFLANKTLSLRLSSRVMMMNDTVRGGRLKMSNKKKNLLFGFVGYTASARITRERGGGGE